MLQTMESLLIGGLAAWLGADAVGFYSPPPNDRSLIDRERRERRLVIPCYSLFEAWIQPLSSLNGKLFFPVIDFIDRGDAEIHPFTAAEFIAICELKSLLCGVSTALVMHGFLQSDMRASFFWGAVVCAAVFWMLLSNALRRCRLVANKIRSRLPFTVELIALLMESGGADILEAVRTAAIENEGHPMGRRLNQLVVAESHGVEFSEALREWSDKYKDDDVIEFAFAVRTSLKRGTPLEETLRALSQQFQQRRLQRLERAAEECKVHITWPGMLVLMACLLIVAAPFILAARDVLGW